MAIKIIKEGKKKIAVYKAKCPICDCVFEFNKEDAYLGEDRDGKFWRINCPHCENQFYSWNVLPIRYDVVESLTV